MRLASPTATSRAHRMGQTEPVTVYRLVARGTIEEAVLAMHATKKALAAAVNEALIIQTVSEGRNAMPPMGAALTPEQIRDVAAFVATVLPH